MLLSQELYTCFAHCVLMCLGTNRFYPYPSGLLHKHWGNHALLYFVVFCCGEVPVNFTHILQDYLLQVSLLFARCRAIIWTNVGILSIGPLGTNFSETSIEIHILIQRKLIWIWATLPEWGPAEFKVWLKILVVYSILIQTATHHIGSLFKSKIIASLTNY